MKDKDLSALAKLKGKLQEEAEEKARLEAIKKEQEKKKAAQANEFKDAMKKLGVEKQDFSGKRVTHEKAKPAPIPKQTIDDNKEVLIASLSDDVGIEHLLENDGRSYHNPNVAPNIPKLLYKGKWTIQGTVDLHGYTVEEARKIVALFIEEQRKLGHRAVRIIHGKGYGSIGKMSILKEKVPIWLVQHKEVLAFVQAPENDGGSGALLVLLAQKKLNS